MLYIDTETTGLCPTSDRVTLFQYKTPGKPTQLWQDPDYKDIHAMLDKHDTIIGHNLPFDFGMLGYIPRDVDHFEDTFYLSRLADFTHDRHSLDAVARRVLGRDPYADLDKKAMQKSDWARAELTAEQIAYATTDVDILPALFAHYKLHVTNNVYRFDKRTVITCLRAQRHGLPILHRAVSAEINAVSDRLNKTLEELPFNPGSPQQTCAALKLGSSGDSVLAELVASDPTSPRGEVAARVRAARGASKYLNFLQKLNAGDRYYGTLSPNARSGRLTSSHENIQNLPRATKRFVGCKVIISADFAQLELRTIAAIAHDTTMLDLFKSGQDLHNYSAEQMYGAQFTPQQRQIAKVFNFSLLYGAGAATVRSMLIKQTGIVLSESEVAELKRKWLASFRGIHDWQRRGAARHAQNKPHRTPHGRPYISSRFTDHLSIENQGAGAEVARIALHKIDETLPEGAYLINCIHDSYIVECCEDLTVYKQAAKAVHDAMKYGWERAPFDKHGLDMPVDVGVAYNLKDADSLTNCVYVYSGEQE